MKLLKVQKELRSCHDEIQIQLNSKSFSDNSTETLQIVKDKIVRFDMRKKKRKVKKSLKKKHKRNIQINIKQMINFVSSHSQQIATVQEYPIEKDKALQNLGESFKEMEKIKEVTFLFGVRLMKELIFV